MNRRCFLIETNSKPRITSYGGNGGMTISGISMEDQERVMACLNAGAYWIRVQNGELEIVPSWEKLPDPVRDEKMFPFWRKPAGNENAQLQLIEMEMIDDHSFPSISIQSLCGYDYSPDNYQMQAEILESYGFECLRSRRGPDGKFWEIWRLGDLLFAKGELKEKIGAHRGKQALKIAVSFLGQHVSFGTLDVSVQRLAMVLED